jgi:hypothetical protein
VIGEDPNLEHLRERLGMHKPKPVAKIQPEPMPEPDLYTLGEVAERLRWSKPTVKKYLPLFRMGAKVGVLRRDYEAFLESHRTPAEERR